MLNFLIGAITALEFSDDNKFIISGFFILIFLFF